MTFKSLHQQLLAQGYETIYCAPSFDEYRQYIANNPEILANSNGGGAGPDYISANARLATLGEEVVLDGYYILYRRKLH